MAVGTDECKPASLYEPETQPRGFVPAPVVHAGVCLAAGHVCEGCRLQPVANLLLCSM